jgi:MFS family permease
MTRNKVITFSLLFGTQFFSFMIRFAFGVVAPTLMELHHLSPKTMGYVLSGWNWSYTAGLPVMGSIVDRFGPYIVMGVGSLVWGVSTIALPIAGAAVPLFLMRMVFGFGQTTLIPAGAIAVSRGFSIKERVRVIAIAFAGNQVGVAVGATVAAFILASLGWQAVFYCIGGASLLLTLAWFVFYPDKRMNRTPAAMKGTTAAMNRVPSDVFSLSAAPAKPMTIWAWPYLLSPEEFLSTSGKTV